MEVRPPPLPALVVGEVSHARRTPLTHAFTHRHYQWLVDIDDLPDLSAPLGVVSRIRSEDHLDGGRLGGGLRGDLTRFLASRGVELADDDRILLLAQARVLGHVFDPLSVFWCLRADGTVRAVVFEVHNTYGERHAYLLSPDANGDVGTDKAFYVSPFNDTSGSYAVRLRLDATHVAVSVGLDREGERVLTAATTGVPRPATRRAVLAVATRHALMPQRVSALIRWHGIRLWLRRLPIQPRPRHPKEAVR